MAGKQIIFPFIQNFFFIFILTDWCYEKLSIDLKELKKKNLIYVFFRSLGTQKKGKPDSS